MTTDSPFVLTSTFQPAAITGSPRPLPLNRGLCCGRQNIEHPKPSEYACYQRITAETQGTLVLQHVQLSGKTTSSGLALGEVQHIMQRMESDCIQRGRNISQGAAVINKT